MTRRTQKPWLWFVLITALLCAVYAALLRQPLSEWRRGAETLRLQEHRYAVKERNLADVDDNKAALAQYEAVIRNDALLPYDGLADALARVAATARAYGLREQSFEAEAPVAHEADAYDGRKVAEIRAEASYEGTFDAVCAFTRTLADDGYFITRLTIDTEAAETETECRLWLAFSLYGAVMYE